MGRVCLIAEVYVFTYTVPWWVVLLSAAGVALVVAAAFIFIPPKDRHDHEV